MESKYYIPKITEFHIGFEFESFVDRFKYWKFNKVGKYELNAIAANINSDFKDLYRVKYLDKEDIESLLNSSEIKYEFSNGILKLKINNDVRFDGICKNVSELKRIVESIKY